MFLVPQVLDLFWSAIEREVEKQGRTATFGRLRRVARYLPYRARRLVFRNVHKQLSLTATRDFVSEREVVRFAFTNRDRE